MPDDRLSFPYLFTTPAAAAETPVKKRTFSDAEVSQAAAPQAAPATPAKRTFSDAEVSAPRASTAAPAVKTMMSSLFETPPPQAIPAYDPSTGMTMRAGPTVEAAQVAQDIALRPGPTIAAAAQLPIAEPTAGERFLAHGERGFENTLAGQARANIQAGEQYKTQADALDDIIAYAEQHNSNVAIPFGSDYSGLPIRETLPLPGGVEKTYTTSQPPSRDPLTGIVYTATTDPNQAAQQTLGVPFAGRDLNELRQESRRLRAQYDTLHDPWLARERQVAGQYAAMPAAHDLAGYAAATLGELGGGMLSPENYIPAGRGATLIRTMGREAFVNGLIGMLVDPAVQRSQIASGARESYDPTQTLMAGVTSAAGGAALPFAGAGFKRLTGVAKNWLARRRGVAPETIDVTTMTPEEQTEFARSPDVQAFIDAHGDQLTPQQIDVLTQRLEARRAAEASPVEKAKQAAATEERLATTMEQPPLEGGAPVSPEQRRGPAAKAGRGVDAEVEAIRREIAGVESGEIAPGAANLPRAREPLPAVIVPERTPVGEPSLAEGVELRRKFHAPAVIEPQPTRMTPEEIAHAQRVGEATGQAPEPMGHYEGKGKNRRWVSDEPPERLLGGERQPMTPTDIEGQRQAAGAFALAERQRQRAMEAPGAVDVRAAGRLRGPQQQRVILDASHPGEPFPVRVIRQGKDRSVVRRYDPRTGRDLPDAVDYAVPTRNLRAGNYAQEPRLAQEVAQARRGPVTPEQPRRPLEGVAREQQQTYRMTPPDVGEPPHVGRAPFPEQPPGATGRPFSTWEQAQREFMERARRRAEERARSQRERYRYQGDAGERAYERARQRYEQGGKGRFTNEPAARGADGRYPVDDNGFVMSTGGGPMRFGDQKQAARWIVGVANKSGTDQIFEIENHPSGQGFGVRERGRGEAPPGETPGGPQEPPPGPEEPPEGQAPPGGPETPPEPPPRAPEGAPRGLAGPEAPEPAARTAPPPEPAAEPPPPTPQTQAAAEPAAQERVTPEPEEPIAQERATEQGVGEAATEMPTPKPKKPRKAKATPPPEEPPEEPPPGGEQTDLGERVEQAPEARPTFAEMKGLDTNEARDLYRSQVDAYWNREIKYTDKHFDEMIARAEKQVADAEHALEQTKGQGMNQQRHALQEKARKAKIEIAVYKYLKEHGYPEPPTLREGYHAVEDVDKASPRDVIELGDQRVRAGDWIGTGNTIWRSGFDKAYDEAWAKSKLPIKEAAKNADQMREFIDKTRKSASKDFNPIFAHQVSEKLTVVYGKVGDKVVAMNGRFYDYAVNQHGLDVKTSKDGDAFAFYDGDKLVGLAAGFRPETKIAANIDAIAKEFEPPLRGKEAAKYRKAPRPAPEARMTEPRVGAEPFKPTKEQKIEAQRLQKEFVSSLEEPRAEAAARRQEEIKRRTAEYAREQKETTEETVARREAERKISDYERSIDDAVKSAQGRYAQTVPGGSHMEPSVARGFKDGVDGITRASTGPSYDYGHRAGVEFAKQHPAPEGYERSTVIERTLRTARGKETRMVIPNTLEAIEGVIERTSSSKNTHLFYSNPFFDPALWRRLAGDIGSAGRVVGSALTKAMSGAKYIAKRGRDEGRALGLTPMGSVLHAIRAKYPNSKALAEHVDMIATDRGSGRHQPETFAEGVERSANAFANRVENIIESAFGRLSTPEERAVLGDLLARRPPSGRVTPEIKKAASELRHLLDLRHFDAEKVGAGIGYVPGYLPRMLDTDAIGKDREGFIKVASHLFKRVGYDDPLTAAETLFQQAIFGDDIEFSRPGLGFGQRHERARTFPKEADVLLRKYLLQDPLELLQRYGIASARRIESARRFGANGEKMQERLRQASRDGLSTEDYQTVQRLTQAILGHGAYSADSTASSHLASAINLLGQVALLPLSALSSLSEPFTAAVTRGGFRGALDGAKAFGHTFAQLSGSDFYKEAQAFARMNGIVARGGMEQIMHNRFGDQAFKRWQRQITERFYERNLLAKLTRGQRTAMTIVGRAQLDQMTKDAAAGDATAKMELRELGIDEASLPKFAKFLDDHDGYVTIDQMADAGEMGRMYGQAVARLVDYTIQNPKKYDKAERATTSQRAIFALMSFNYAYWRNVQRSTLRKVVQGAKTKDPARVISMMAGYSTAAGMAMLFGYGREKLLNPDNWEQRTETDKAMLLASRSNLFGILDPVINTLVGGLKYDRSFADLGIGAYAAIPYQLADATMEYLRDTSSGNASKRKLVRAIYGSTVLPLIEGGMSAIPVGRFGPVGEAILSSTMFSSAAPMTKNAIIDLFAGKKGEGKRGRKKGTASGTFGTFGGGERESAGAGTF